MAEFTVEKPSFDPRKDGLLAISNTGTIWVFSEKRDAWIVVIGRGGWSTGEESSRPFNKDEILPPGTKITITV